MKSRPPQSVFDALKGEKRGPTYGRDLGWAHRIMERKAAGHFIHPGTLAIAVQALKEHGSEPRTHE